MEPREEFTSIKNGLLEFALLRIISGEPVYVADILKKLSDTEFKTREGTLYPLLSRMRREAWLDYDWKESEAGPPRKYYRLTTKGKERLAATNNYWKKIISTINTFGK